MAEQPNIEFKNLNEPLRVSLNIMNGTDSPRGKMTGVIKYPGSFKVSKEFFTSLVEDYTMRSFSEEIDKLEAFGGISNLINRILFIFYLNRR